MTSAMFGVVAQAPDRLERVAKKPYRFGAQRSHDLREGTCAWQRSRLFLASSPSAWPAAPEKRPHAGVRGVHQAAGAGGSRADLSVEKLPDQHVLNVCILVVHDAFLLFLNFHVVPRSRSGSQTFIEQVLDVIQM